MEPGTIFEAQSIGCQTLVGFNRDMERPNEYGNCFGVYAQKVTRDDVLQGVVKEYKIVNFNVENLEALIKLGLTWPIKCKALSGRVAVIHDPRIGERWYSKRYCETCCPDSLLPITQKQAHERAVMRGTRKEVDGFVSINFKSVAEFP